MNRKYVLVNAGLVAILAGSAVFAGPASLGGGLGGGFGGAVGGGLGGHMNGTLSGMTGSQLSRGSFAGNAQLNVVRGTDKLDQTKAASSAKGKVTGHAAELAGTARREAHTTVANVDSGVGVAAANAEADAGVGASVATHEASGALNSAVDAAGNARKASAHASGALGADVTKQASETTQTPQSQKAASGAQVTKPASATKAASGSKPPMSVAGSGSQAIAVGSHSLTNGDSLDASHSTGSTEAAAGGWSTVN